mmetsp:Transcript_6560/g.7148  ORF Transcript_6560/g.7148 Transcript_6560/m.7148 type:complete len:154 (-) Transcript_6560:166-627(-)
MQHLNNETISIFESGGGGRILIIPSYDNDESDASSFGTTNTSASYHSDQKQSIILNNNMNNSSHQQTSWTNSVLRWIGFENSKMSDDNKECCHQNQNDNTTKQFSIITNRRSMRELSSKTSYRKEEGRKRNNRFPPYELFDHCAVTRLDLDSL